MHRYFIKKCLSLGLIYFLFISCNTQELQNRQYFYEDSLQKVRAKSDSLRKDLIANLKKIKAKKTVYISDKTIQVISNSRLSKEIQYQFESNSYSTTYKREIAEREEILFSFRIKFSSKSKYTGSQKDFFPHIIIYKIQNEEFLINVGEMKWRLYREDDDMNFRFLEQIFDYKESEVFVCWTNLSTPIRDKFVIVVQEGDSEDININNIIGFINPS